jgi:hypothetical protein
MNEDIPKGSHPLQFTEKLLSDYLFFEEYLQNFAVRFWLRVASVSYDVITDIQQTLDRQMQVAFGSSVNKRVFFETGQIIFLHRFQRMKIFPQFLQPPGYNISLNQRNPPS